MLIFVLQKSNALLESPTGTGKTLSLLCSSLAWLESIHVNQLPSQLSGFQNDINFVQNNFGVFNNLPRIIYSSRTHAQLSQAIREMKRTYYKTFPAVVLGSRDQLCLNNEVQKLESISAKNLLCKYKINTKSCPYYYEYETKITNEKEFSDIPVLDIEDLVTLGKKHTCCPYYASRHLKSKASVIFTPYNYLLDQSMNRAQQFELKNSVVIFDEGHNIEKVCEESVSTELRSGTLALSMREIRKIIEKLNEEDEKNKLLEETNNESNLNELTKDLDVENVAHFLIILSNIERAIDDRLANIDSNKAIETEILFEIMEQAGLGFKNSNQILSTIDKISLLLAADNSLPSTTDIYTSVLPKLSELINILFPENISPSQIEQHKIEFIKMYKIFFTKNDTKNNPWISRSKNSWTLQIFCLSPSVGMKALVKQEVHNVIITSGTLCPLDSFEIELGIPFPIKLQNSHVIKKHQLNISIIGSSSNGFKLCSTYDNRENQESYKALGQTLVELLQVIPGGVFIFFSSYTSLERSIEMWKNNDLTWKIWQILSSTKKIFIEPRNKVQFAKSINEYKIEIDNKIGAAFLGVCRGKLAEGLDLSNNYCRAVIMTGLPYVNRYDPRVMLKEKYIDEMKFPYFTSKNWYGIQMTRALNQAVGRVVRHKDDFGAVILCDARFFLLKNGLPNWIENLMISDNSEYKVKIGKIKTFFQQLGYSVCNTTSTMTITNQTIIKSKTIEIETNLTQKNKSDVINDRFISQTKLFSEFSSQESYKSLSTTNNVFDALTSRKHDNCCFEFSNENNKRKLTVLKDNSSECQLKKSKINVKLRSIIDPDLEQDKTIESNKTNDSNDVNATEKNDLKNSIELLKKSFLEVRYCLLSEFLSNINLFLV